MIELIIKKDDREINRYFLPQGVTTLGRAEDNTIILDDSCVSRRHARIKVDGGKVSIEDMGSGNGTFRGEARIEREDLSDGDEIIIEPFTLLLRKDANPQKVVDSTRPVPAAGSQRSSERIEAAPSRAARQPGGAAAGGPRLEVVRGEGGPYLLSGEEQSIGRSDEAKITLQDPSSSRKHAAISRGSRGWTIKDLGSANGTFLNGAPVKDEPLRDGDIILIGNTELRFCDPEGRSAADAAEEIPRTAPVPRSSPRAARSLAPEPEEESEERPARRPPPKPASRPARGAAADDAFEMSAGSFDGGGQVERSTGSMPPMDEPSGGGTEAGGPPPGWGNGGDQTGEGAAVDLQGYGNESGEGDGFGGGEEYGMEIDDALFPGGQRPPDSVVGKFLFSLKTNRVTQLLVLVGGLAFVMVLIAGNKPTDGAGGRGNAKSKFVTKLSQKQEITLNTMEQDKRDALALLGQEGKPDYQGAFLKYSQIINFGGNDEMKLVRDAQILRQEAIDAVYSMHEALVVLHLQRATGVAQNIDTATKARIARDQREGRANIELAKRRGKGSAAVAAWSAAISAWNDLLQVLPNDAEAKTQLALATSERRKLVGDLNEAALNDLKARCQRQMDVSAAKFRAGTIRGYQEGIKEYEKILAVDPTEQTQFPTAAKAQINAGKKKLADAARPLRDQAVALQGKTSWLEARKAIRRAIETDPYTTSYLTTYEQIEHECLKNAAQQIQEARVYLDAENYGESKKAALLALQYADQDTDKENKNAKEIIKTLSRRTEVPK